MLRGTGLKKRFGAFDALAGVDIEVYPGRISILLGPSGGGKTTLIRTLSLIDPPSAGVVQIDDVSYNFPMVSTRAMKEPWPYLTVVFQQHFLWPHLTLRQNIELPLSVRADAASIDQIVGELCDFFGMTSFVDRFPNEVSLGERQRAALARALALQPKYILLDEITSSLDVEQAANVTRYLLKLRNQGIGILVVTHLLAFARRLVEQDRGDLVFFLDRGRVVEKGGAEFFVSPTMERVRSFLAALNFQDEVVLPR